MDENPPASWITFRDQVRACDGIIFVTPEYNRSIPGVLKNAIDIASRPYGKSAWTAKPAAVVSTSPGATGGFGSNQHLRQTFVFLDLFAMQQPEMYIGHVDKYLNEKGEINNDDTKKLLQKFMNTFADWVETFHKSKATA